MRSIPIWTNSFFFLCLILKCYSGWLILSLSSSVWVFPAFSSFLGDAIWAVEHYRNKINGQIQVIKSMSTLHLLKMCAQRFISWDWYLVHNFFFYFHAMVSNWLFILWEDKEHGYRSQTHTCSVIGFEWRKVNLPISEFTHTNHVICTYRCCGHFLVRELNDFILYNPCG